jgi:hypothetical protein
MKPYMKIPYKDNKKPAAGEAEIFLELHGNSGVDIRICAALGAGEFNLFRPINHR